VTTKVWRSTFFDRENPRHDNYRQNRESRRSLLTLTSALVLDSYEEYKKARKQAKKPRWAIPWERFHCSFFVLFCAFCGYTE
jgi:hypothetical protein